MTLRPCIECGDLVEPPASRCDMHKRKQSPRPSATARGYGYQWQKLRAEALRIQIWCSDCGTTGTPSNPMTIDHSPEAWVVVQQGKQLTLKHFRDGLLTVVCANCNRKRGTARGPNSAR